MKRNASPDETAPKKPRTRRDVAERHQRNKETSCSVVKSTLNKFCKGDCVALRDPLNLIVKEVNRAVAEAYLLANLHVNRMIADSLPLTPPGPELFLWLPVRGHPSSTEVDRDQECRLQRGCAAL